MITTKPKLLIPIKTLASYYAVSAIEPDAGDWTLVGTDYADILDNALIIDNVPGSDQSYYSQSITDSDIDADSLICLEVKVKAEALAASHKLQLWSAGLGGVKLEVDLAGSTTGYLTFTGGGTATLDITTDYVTLIIQLTATSFKCWNKDTGALLKSGTPGTYSGSDDLIVIFGKLSTSTDTNATYYKDLKVSILDSFAANYPPVSWNNKGLDAVETKTISYSGTPETINHHVAENITGVLGPLTEAEATSLRTLVKDHLIKGEEFFLFEDASAMYPLIPVILDDKKFKPKMDRCRWFWSPKFRMV